MPCGTKNRPYIDSNTTSQDSVAADQSRSDSIVLKGVHRDRPTRGEEHQIMVSGAIVDPIRNMPALALGVLQCVHFPSVASEPSASQGRPSLGGRQEVSGDDHDRLVTPIW